MKNNHKTLNEEILRIKSLFTEERLYGNLVEQDEKIYKDFGDSYDYKVVDGKWYTQKKGGKTWTNLSDNEKYKSSVDKLNKRYPNALKDTNTDNTKVNTDNTVKSGNTNNTVTSGNTNNTVTSGNTNNTVTSGNTNNTVTSGNTNTEESDPFDITGVDVITKDEIGDIRYSKKIERDNIKSEFKRRLRLCDDLIKSLSKSFLPILRKRRISKKDWSKVMGVNRTKSQTALFEACSKIDRVKDKYSTGSFINGENRLDSIAGILSGKIDEETHLTSKMGRKGDTTSTPTTADTQSTVTNNDNKKVNTDNTDKTWIVHSNSFPWGKLVQRDNKLAFFSDKGQVIGVPGTNRVGSGVINRYIKNPRNKIPQSIIDSLESSVKNGDVEVKKKGKTIIFTIK